MTLAEFSQARNAVDERITCSIGKRCDMNPVLTRPTSQPPPAHQDHQYFLFIDLDGADHAEVRWRDGMKQLQFDYSPFTSLSGVGSHKPFEVISFAECSNTPLPPGLKKIYFDANWNIVLRGVGESWMNSLESIFYPGNVNQPLPGEGVGLPQGLRDTWLRRILTSP